MRCRLFPQPTTAPDMAIRSLDLRPDDEILTTNHEHGAMDRAWRIAGPAPGLGESPLPEAPSIRPLPSRPDLRQQQRQRPEQGIYVRLAVVRLN